MHQVEAGHGSIGIERRRRAAVRHYIGSWLKQAERTASAWAVAISPVEATVRSRAMTARPGLACFNAEEAALLEILVDLILPSDDTGPGASDLARAGRPLLHTLDGRAAAEPRRRALYARGVVALNRVVRARFGRAFSDLDRAEQLTVLRSLDERRAHWSAANSIPARVLRRASWLYYRWTGLYVAVEFLSTVVREAFQAFYSDPVSWQWLQYDGPPMPGGYPGLEPRR